jgi:hypothetical protein
LGVAFVLPPDKHSPSHLELILNASDCQLMGVQQPFIVHVRGENGIRTIPGLQFAILRTAFVSRPGGVP